MKPILFSTPMVQAILDGRKTQTRRIAKNFFYKNMEECGKLDDSYIFKGIQGFKTPCALFFSESLIKSAWAKVPYQIGDILYVKETYKFGTYKVVDDVAYVAIDYIAGPKQKTPWVKMQGDIGKILVQCDEDIIKSKIINQLTNKPVLDGEAYYCKWEVGESPYRVRPSIFMPQAYARIFLKVINVRVERLQDISEEDAIAEGIEQVGGEASLSPWRNYLKGKKGEMLQHCSSPKRSYQTLWDSINKKEPEKQWQANPYVFIYEFERIEKPEENNAD